ncbi:hypothetical protein [Neobacillus niacini]|uniref:hypothetical protein n=1 Tax=Neobacillus niacini TaxID=86668 RepID=UPI00147097C8|nr:hypothetical protein [Neobacillus niacini]
MESSNVYTKQNITGMINRLHQANLVALFADPVDKRRTRVRVTKEGHQIYQQLSSSRNEFKSTL